MLLWFLLDQQQQQFPPHAPSRPVACDLLVSKENDVHKRFSDWLNARVGSLVYHLFKEMIESPVHLRVKYTLVVLFDVKV